MGDRLEPASTGRARCRACGTGIDKGTLRFGEEVANAYGEDDASTVYWFHPRCAALRRPDKLLPLLHGEVGLSAPDRAGLLVDAERGVAHPRLARLDGVERASSGRARCRQCQEPIAGGAWRFRLSSFAETGYFDPLGFIHVACAPAYFETAALESQLRRVAPDLDDASVSEVLAGVAPAAG
jgi:hypothetical protein